MHGFDWVDGDNRFFNQLELDRSITVDLFAEMLMVRSNHKVMVLNTPWNDTPVKEGLQESRALLNHPYLMPSTTVLKDDRDARR